MGENEEKVYCPDCGTPMHRLCWNELGHCPNRHRHAEGFNWENQEADAQPEQPQESFSQDAATASAAGAYTQQERPQNAQTMEEFIRQSMPKLDENPDEEKYMGVSEKELAIFCNLRGYQGIYRLSALKNMALSGKKTSFNIWAGLLYPYSQFYYGIFPLAFVFLFAQMVLMLPQVFVLYVNYFGTQELAEMLYSNAGFLAMSTLFSYLELAATVLLCVFGDYLYLSFAAKKIKQIRAQMADKSREEYFMTLAVVGKPRFSRAIMGIIATAILTIGVMIAISLGIG